MVLHVSAGHVMYNDSSESEVAKSMRLGGRYDLITIKRIQVSGGSTLGRRETIKVRMIQYKNIKRTEMFV